MFCLIASRGRHLQAAWRSSVAVVLTAAVVFGRGWGCKGAARSGLPSEKPAPPLMGISAPLLLEKLPAVVFCNVNDLSRGICSQKLTHPR